MADRTWAAAAKLGKPAYTVVLKLKTSEFRTLTRSWTGEAALSSSGMLADRAVDLLARVNLPPATRFRLVGVGASNFRDPEADAQRSLI
jgi:DNA polymerase IV